jgi:hypothetical protein
LQLLGHPEPRNSPFCSYLNARDVNHFSFVVVKD